MVTVRPTQNKPLSRQSPSEPPIAPSSDVQKLKLHDAGADTATVHESPSDKNPKETDEYTVLTSLLFDSKAQAWLTDVSVRISRSSGLVTSLSPTTSLARSVLADPSTLDLRGYTVIPGLVDSHTHIFVHPYSETPSVFQERDEPLVERLCRGTVHARAALLGGYTTYRDLGSEGLADADIGFRDAVNRGIIPGPRMYVVSDPLATSAGYAIRYESRLNGTRVPRLADACDGVDACVAGVRRRLGAGADVIKFYADYRRRTLRFPQPNWPGAKPIQFPPTAPAQPKPKDAHLTGADGAHAVGDIPANPFFFAGNPSSTLFTLEEMKAIVRTARAALCPVAAHCVNGEAAVLAAKAGVTTIEHNYIPDDAPLHAMKENNVLFVPTLSTVDADKPPGPVGDAAMQGALEHTKRAYDLGVRIAAGGDTGTFPHGENVRELEFLKKAGLPLEEVLAAGTIRGWEACGGDWAGRRFGHIGEGWAADLVALNGDPREDMGALRKVKMVIKDGRVVVDEGRIVGWH